MYTKLFTKNINYKVCSLRHLLALQMRFCRSLYSHYLSQHRGSAICNGFSRTAARESNLTKKNIKQQQNVYKTHTKRELDGEKESRDRRIAPVSCAWRWLQMQLCEFWRFMQTVAVLAWLLVRRWVRFMIYSYL